MGQKFSPDFFNTENSTVADSLGRSRLKRKSSKKFRSIEKFSLMENRLSAHLSKAVVFILTQNKCGLILQNVTLRKQRIQSFYSLIFFP